MSANPSEKKTIQYTDRQGKEISLTVGYANVLMDTRRGILQQRADEANRSEDDEARAILRRFVYPDCVAAVIEQQGFARWPVSFDEFCAMEPRLVGEWSTAAYEVNPEWRLKLPEGDDLEKKA